MRKNFLIACYTLTFINICPFILPLTDFLFTDILYMCVFVTVTALSIVDDDNKEATYLLTY